MAATRLKEYLDDHGVRYVSIRHSPAFTAPEIAASADVSGNDFAKAVIVTLDDQMAMVVVPANRRIVLSELRDLLPADSVHLASEVEFEARFSDCEVGAMPPFGHLYGLPVYLDRSLAARKQIAFSAGTHHEVIRMALEDYATLAKPIVMELATT